MDNNRRQVLDMLAEGKINVDEAERLNVDVEALAKQLNGVYANRQVQAREGRASIAADPRTNRLIVTGSSAEIAQIQQLLSKLEMTAGNTPQSQSVEALNALGCDLRVQAIGKSGPNTASKLARFFTCDSP